ncbi:MAG: tetratricopeptide repeat protein [Planctomycetes bacterium]|nr:tetratricopeptide repeat protein [Planctomycetota bacterium]
MTRLEQLQKLAALHPDDAMLPYGIGLEYINLERWTDAIAAFDQALKLDNNLSAAHYHKARSEIKDGRHESARATLATGIEVALAAGDRKTVSEMHQLLDTIS